jgi:hypothetical protein
VLTGNDEWIEAISVHIAEACRALIRLELKAKGQQALPILGCVETPAIRLNQADWWRVAMLAAVNIFVHLRLYPLNGGERVEL